MGLGEKGKEVLTEECFRHYSGGNIYTPMSHYPNFRAKLALDLFRSGVCSTAFDEMPSREHQVHMVDEAVRDACNQADALVNEFFKRGWMMPVEVRSNTTED